MRVVTLLLHDERFSGWSIGEKIERTHFAKRYLEYCKSFGWEPYLYTFHESVSEKKVYEIDDLGVIKVFPVELRLPPFLPFGNDHNPKAVLRELAHDEPQLVHFHQYYMFSFPYVARFVKKRLGCPLTTQLHGYHQDWWRRLLYAPSLLSLKVADLILYSYTPERRVYRSLGLTDRGVLVPMPSIDPKVFNPGGGGGTGDVNLLYVGRVPLSLKTYGDKAPILLLYLMRELLRYREVSLTIIGDGSGLGYCRQLASELGIHGRVEFKGYIHQNQLPAYYRDSLLTIVPIQLEDIDGFFDGAIQESLACGTMVAALKPSPDTPLEGSRGFLLSRDMARSAKEVSCLLKDVSALHERGEEASRFVHRHCTEKDLKRSLRSSWEGVIRG